MKALRFSEAEKAFILKQGVDKMPVADTAGRCAAVASVHCSFRCNKPRNCADRAGPIQSNKSLLPK